MADSVSLRAFGAMIGVSGEAVRKAIASGRIPAHLVGKKARGSGMAPVILNPQQAAAAWQQNTSVAKAHQQARTRVPRGALGGAGDPDGGGAGDPPAGGGALPGGVSEFNRARMVREAFQAKLTQLEFEEKSGLLIKKADVRVAVFNAGRQLRDRLTLLKDRLAPMLAAESDQHAVAVMLEEEIHRALEEVADGFKRATAS
ncbi:MAG: hypothetical protein ACRCVK_11260 [Aeromonas veronii]